MPFANLFKRGADADESLHDDEGFSAVEVSGVNPKTSSSPTTYQLDSKQACSLIADLDWRAHNGAGIIEKDPSAIDAATHLRSGFWQSMYLSLFSSGPQTRQDSLKINQEPFNMSRESFDSYRRCYVRLQASSSGEQQSNLIQDKLMHMSSQDVSTRIPTSGSSPASSRPSTESSRDFDVSTPQSDFEARLRAMWPDDMSICEQETIFEEIALDDNDDERAMAPAPLSGSLFLLQFGRNTNSYERGMADICVQGPSSSQGGGKYGFFSSTRWVQDYVDEVEELDDLSRPSSAGQLDW